MKTIRVEVTEEDIREGLRDDCRQCPVARAISRTLLRPVVVTYDSWDYAEILGLQPESEARFALPDRIEWQVREFDFSGSMDPFSFNLEVPE